MNDKLELLKGLLERLNKSVSVIDTLVQSKFDESVLLIIVDALIEDFKKEVKKLDAKNVK